MWRGNDSPAEAAALLRKEIRHLGLRIQQTLSDDGETAQSRSGGCRHCVGQYDGRTWHGVYVPREGRGQGCYHGDILTSDTRHGRRTAHGASALFDHRKERTDVCASIPPSQQLARQEPLSVWQLQHDQHRRGVSVPDIARPVAAHLWRRLYHTRTDGPPTGPGGGTAV